MGEWKSYLRKRINDKIDSLIALSNNMKLDDNVGEMFEIPCAYNLNKGMDKEFT